MGEMWLFPYESDSFKDDMEELWEQLRPLYENLHAYVRMKLVEVNIHKPISLADSILILDF